MQREKANYSIKRMARLLKVSRSGYYKWSHTQHKRLSGEDDRAIFYDDVDRKIHQIWSDSDEVYGAPRITAELTAEAAEYLRGFVLRRPLALARSNRAVDAGTN